MNVVLLSSGSSASCQLSPRKRRIFTVCHFRPRVAAQSIAGIVSPFNVTSVAPAHTVVRMGMRGSEIEVFSTVSNCMIGGPIT